MDASLYEAINGLAGHVGAIDDFFKIVSLWGAYILVAFGVLLWFWPGSSLERERRQWGAITAAIAALLALGFNQLFIRFIWARPRPFVSHTAHMLLTKSTDPSFPSDHAAGAFAIAIAVLLYSRRAGIIALIFAVLLAFSRVYTGEHYPGDVVGGAVVGCVAAYVVYLARPLLAVVLERPIQLARRYHLA